MIGLSTAIRRVVAAAILSAFVGPSALHAQTRVPVAPDVFSLEGFRSAQFGMTEVQVRQAIRKDFDLGTDKITIGENSSDRTMVVSVLVDNLLDGSGLAQIAYVFGFNTKKLIQITITWGGSISHDLKPETAVVMANQLRNYFAGIGYKSGSIVANTRMPDGTLTVFRGLDTNDRMTLLTLVGEAPEAAAARQPPTLQLSYVLDPRNPDIFRIAKGRF